MGCNFLLQVILPTQGLNLNLLSPLHYLVSSLPLVPHEKPEAFVDSEFSTVSRTWLSFQKWEFGPQHSENLDILYLIASSTETDKMGIEFYCLLGKEH